MGLARALAEKSPAVSGRAGGEKSSPAIQRDLVNGYIQNGDVQGNLSARALKDPAAEASYSTEA